MARLPVLPTLNEFLDEARRQGCTQRTVRKRLVLENPRTGVAVVLKQMAGNERLTQFYAEYLSRALAVTGFNADEIPTTFDWTPSDPEAT